MKKYLFFYLIITTCFANAQSLVDTNKVWNVVSCLNFGPCGTTAFHFGSDTLIGNYQYKKLVITNYSLLFPTFSFIPLAAREDSNTKKVYFYDGNNEYLVYDFSLVKGQTFTPVWPCQIQIQFQVDSVDTITLLNGEKRKRIIFQGNDVWVEGIGSLYGLISPFYNLCLYDVYNELNCFKENDTLKFQNPQYTDCFYNTLGVTELARENYFQLMPNPFSEFTILSFENPLYEDNIMRILNTNGQLIKQLEHLKGNQFKIERGDMKSGIYFFQIMNDSRMIVNGKIVVQ